MDFGLNGKVALVTGAGSQIGFGKAISMALAMEGCDIVAADLDLAGAQKTAADIEALGRKSLALKVDVTNGADVNKMVKAALDKFNKIDILVNNAGGTNAPKPFADSNEKEWDFDINLNLKGTLHVTKAVIGQMIARKSGKIINISSGAGIIGIPACSIYSAAKAGIITFTKSLATELAPFGINVNSVSPGMAMTGFQKNTPQEFIERVKKQLPLGRFTTTQDIANAVLYFASDLSSDCVGQILCVSGETHG